MLGLKMNGNGVQKWEVDYDVIERRHERDQISVQVV